MKSKLTLSMASIFLVFLSAVAEKPKHKVNIKSDFVKIAKDLPVYIAATEVSNLEYRNFLEALEQAGSKEKLKLAQPDNNKWNSVFDNASAFKEYYFTHKAYDNYPVVNISRQAAEAYCEWLTEQYNNTHKDQRLYRLPTEAEWMKAAKAGNESAIYPWSGSSLTYEKKGAWQGEQLANYRVDAAFSSSDKKQENMDVTAPVKSYFPNDLGIYNMAGNVAEMVAEKGVTKGGAWFSSADKLKIDAREEITDEDLAKPTVGFRPIYVIMK